jgi:UDP-2-acetamido-2,6-beta-L-arabino-hexul-4-ose reductase
MRIVITGADGFIGRNLYVRLTELGFSDVGCITRSTSPSEAQVALAAADCVFHLAGVNRPQDPAEFATGNTDVTRTICDSLREAGRRATLVFTSSIQAVLDNPYGESKRAAENVVWAYGRATGAAVRVFRLTNVFGKWARPNYNSAVATFCHNIWHRVPLTVNDPNAPIQLVYVDDVIAALVQCIQAKDSAVGESSQSEQFAEAGPVYSTTVGSIADILRSFAESRTSLLTPPVGSGLVRALYSTYLSYVSPASFAYEVPRHADPRGVFVEMLKTPDCGQFSYFTAVPGITRGEHYHHSKTEKFLVIKGTAHFGFRHITSDETHEIIIHGGEAKIVETVPGWTHNITNIGEDELIVMLWANEIFDRQRPDTVAMKVSQ